MARSFSFSSLKNRERIVITGLVPVIHVLLFLPQSEDVDGRVIGERKRRRPSDGYARP
jgi:hypothetical protein